VPIQHIYVTGDKHIISKSLNDTQLQPVVLNVEAFFITNLQQITLNFMSLHLCVSVC